MNWCRTHPWRRCRRFWRGTSTCRTQAPCWPGLSWARNRGNRSLTSARRPAARPRGSRNGRETRRAWWRTTITRAACGWWRRTRRGWARPASRWPRRRPRRASRASSTGCWSMRRAQTRAFFAGGWSCAGGWNPRRSSGSRLPSRCCLAGRRAWSGRAERWCIRRAALSPRRTRR